MEAQRAAAAGGAQAGADPARTAVVLARLAALLQTGDVAVNDLAQQESGLLRAALGGAAENLLQCIAEFDYQAALDTLRAAKRSNST